MAFIVELLMDMLVFEDPSLGEVMYCPECDKEHRNGEEFHMNLTKIKQNF